MAVVVVAVRVGYRALSFVRFVLSGHHPCPESRDFVTETFWLLVRVFHDLPFRWIRPAVVARAASRKHHAFAPFLE